jgi:signal transduction histidine kinase
VIYRSDPGQSASISGAADASVGLFDVRFDQLFRRWEPAAARPGLGAWRFPGPPGVPAPGFGRWQLFVRHRAGSLETVVARARWRNLGVNAGILVLMLASVAALIRYTRRAQKLAELQMDFVAGVSHELRTPLTVIHTAAYNLRGKVAGNPAQVERYGELIQQESGRLKELVEQVLRFAGANAGHAIQQREPLSIETVIDESMEASKSVIQRSRCVVEKSIDPGLPLVLGDPVALKQALENLLSNAAKYGAEGSRWIGVFASKARDREREMVEIRVADRGPGIPPNEQAHIFDPFFRGRRAVEDQVHGTGLGLNLVKKIVEAHGGSIRVNSEPMKGSQFIVRIPAAPAEAST